MRGMKLSVKLPLLIVLSVSVCALIIFALGAYLTRNSLRAVEMEANSNSVHAYTSAASFYLEQACAVLETTAALPQITDLASAGPVDPALHGVPADAAVAQRNVATSMLKNSDIFEYVEFIEADGTVCLVEPYELQVQALSGSVAFTNWYQELMSSGKTVISELLISNITKRPSVTIATPVRNSAGQIIGILAGGLKLEVFSQMASHELAAGTLQRYGYITDSRGLIIAHQANPKYVQDQTDFSSSPPVRAALSGQDGTMQYICPIDGRDELGAYMPLPGTEWAVVYLVPTQIAFAPLTRLIYTTLLIAVAIAIIVAIVGLFMVRRQITRPLGQLTAAATAMGTGDLSQRVKVTTGDELGRLGTEVNQMAERLSATLVSRDDLVKEVAERKKAEEALVLSRQFLNNVIEQSPISLWISDSEGTLIQMNQVCHELFGITDEEAVGKYNILKDNLIEEQGFIPLVKNVFEKGEIARFTIDYDLPRVEHIKVEKATHRILDVIVAPIKDINNKVINVMVQHSDITAREQAEAALHKYRDHLEELVKERTKKLEDAQEKLLASERLVTLGQFSGSLSHELKNSLATIDSSVYYLKAKLEGSDEKVQTHLDRIGGTVKVAVAVIQSLLNLTQVKEPNLARLDLRLIAAESIEPDKVPPAVEVVRHFAAREVGVNADPEQLRVAFGNIVKNAVQAMEGSGTLTVTVRISPDGKAEASFADTGPGIPTDNLTNIFQPLFSTKAKGIGFGLSIAKMIVERHGGIIEAKSEMGKGANIIIRLPLEAKQHKEDKHV